MGNLSINAFFCPSLHNYWGAHPPGPSPSYGTALNWISPQLLLSAIFNFVPWTPKQGMK